MCFLKNISQPLPYNPSSAFKKVEVQAQSSSSDDSEEIKQEGKLESKGYEVTRDSSESESAQPTSTLNEFQKVQFNFLLNLLQTNSSTMWTLLEKNQKMERTIESLSEQLDSLKKRLVVCGTKKTLLPIELDENSYDDQLIVKLLGKREYKYKMVLEEVLPSQLYKERNFDLLIKIVDRNENIILNSNPIPISLCVYTSDDQPELIHTNKTQQPILKGNSEAQLFHGHAAYKKIHLREVSSYYKNGWLTLFIFPKAPSFNYNTKESSLQETISFDEVKPLVISQLVVRAKKK